MPRILSVDYGDRKVGVAVSDPLKIIATPLDTLRIQSPDEAVERIKVLNEEYKFECVVVGYPKNLKGEKTKQTLKVDTFIEKLSSAVSCKIIEWDEVYTSSEAKRILIQKGIKTGYNKELVDQMAARIILQEYLDTH